MSPASLPLPSLVTLERVGSVLRGAASGFDLALVRDEQVLVVAEAVDAGDFVAHFHPGAAVPVEEDDFAGAVLTVAGELRSIGGRLHNVYKAWSIGGNTSEGSIIALRRGEPLCDLVLECLGLTSVEELHSSLGADLTAMFGATYARPS